METTNGYVVTYNGKHHDVYANDLWSAKKKFILENKVPKKRQWEVSPILVEKNVPVIDGKPDKGTQVTHSISGI